MNKPKSIYKDLEAKLDNWTASEVFDFLNHLRANPNKVNNRLEKRVTNYINNY